jgi:hypothetical protein
MSVIHVLPSTATTESAGKATFPKNVARSSLSDNRPQSIVEKALPDMVWALTPLRRRKAGPNFERPSGLFYFLCKMTCGPRWTMSFGTDDTLRSSGMDYTIPLSPDGRQIPNRG